MPVPISQCSVFIQIWVDTNSAQAGTTKGIYLVDNRISSGSQNEGTATLQTACTNNSYICWQVFAVDPNFAAIGGNLSIQSIGNSNAWGNSGQPQSLNANTFTGQVQNGGTANYQLSLNLQSPGLSGMTLTVNPSVNVTAASFAAVDASDADSYDASEPAFAGHTQKAEIA
jgi:hypothetical protein